MLYKIYYMANCHIFIMKELGEKVRIKEKCVYSAVTTKERKSFIDTASFFKQCCFWKALRKRSLLYNA